MMVSLSVLHALQEYVCDGKLWCESFSSSDGIGYVEDGREIFDDDLDDDVVENNKGKHSYNISLHNIFFVFWVSKFK